MAAGDWSKIETTARANHWAVDTPQNWTMVLSRATRSLTLYFDSDSGDLARALTSGREMRARNATVLAARVIQMLKS